MGLLMDEALPFEFSNASKVNQQADAHTCSFEIVDQLRFFFAGKPIDCLQFNNDLVKANQIGNVFFVQALPFIINYQRFCGSNEIFRLRNSIPNAA